MGGCASVNATFAQSASVAIGPTPSILPRREFDDVKEMFTFEKELARGTISTLHRVIDKHSGEVYVCKSISKLKVCSMDDLKDVKQEIKIFKHLSTSEHPNIAQFVQSFEDKTQVHIVMEECSGGDLFDRILTEKKFGEQEAARLLHAVISVVQHCHAMNVVHRDIKPESFRYLSNSPDAPIKAVDFGIAAFIREEGMDEVIGSPHYVAPEMLRGQYGREVDLWSCGVLLYVLLCGYPPFHGNTNEEIFEQIVSSPLNLKSDPWPEVSPAAKELVRKLLLRDPKRRFTADQVLQHRWFQEQAAGIKEPAAPAVLTRMRQFAQFNKLKKEALKVIAGSLPEGELEGMMKVFKSIDRDDNGNISVEELRRGLKAQGASVGMTEVSQILNGVDIDGNHRVDYLEFLAATMKDIARGLSERDRADHLMQAFKHFDLDGSGYITPDELAAVLQEEGKHLTPEAVAQILAEVDKDRDGKIDYEEFSSMITQGDSAGTGASQYESTLLRIEPLLSQKLREAPLIDNVQEAADQVMKSPSGKAAHLEDRPSNSSVNTLSSQLSGPVSRTTSSVGNTSSSHVHVDSALLTSISETAAARLHQATDAAESAVSGAGADLETVPEDTAVGHVPASQHS